VRANPDAHEGVLPELVRLEVRDERGRIDRLSDDELITFFGVTIFAGVETTAHAVGEAVVAAIEQPGLFDEVAEAGECLPPVVEEFLRWRGTVVNFRRTASENHELRGVRIRENDKVLILFPSANRDERHFPRPDVFDPKRQPLDHVSFGGGGPHICLGAQLARLDLRLLFGELFRRVRRFEPAGTPMRLRSNQLAGWIHVPVTAVAR
jgi:cytochrome P450